MNRSDSILEFIDGTLDQGLEQELFEEMASRPELRTELQQYVQIGQAARNDPEAFAPPAEVERGLLGGLGLLPTAGGAGGAAVAGSTAASIFSIATLKSSLAPLLVGFLAGALLIGGGVFFMKDQPQINVSLSGMESKASDAYSGSASGASGVEGSQTLSAESDELNDNRSGYARKNSNWNHVAPSQDHGDLSEENTVQASAASEPEVSADNSEEIVQDATQPQVESDPTSSRSELLARADVRHSSMVIDDVDQLVANHVAMERDHVEEARSTLRSISSTQDSPGLGDRVNRRGVSLAVRKNVTPTPFADNDARSVQTDIWENTAVTADMYIPDVSDGFSLVGEVGSERVAQSLFHNRNDSIIIDQRPLLPWFAVGVGMEFDVLDVPVHGRVTLGGTFTSGSPMARASLDVNLLKLLPVSDGAPFSIPVGLQTSSFVYTYNGQYMFSGNWGLSAGFGYNFGW